MSCSIVITRPLKKILLGASENVRAEVGAKVGIDVGVSPVCEQLIITTVAKAKA
jgi:hypothetical protein